MGFSGVWCFFPGKRFCAKKPLLRSDTPVLHRHIPFNLHLPGIFTERQKKELAGSAQLLLWQLSVDVKKAQKAKDLTGKQKFLLAVQNWTNNRQSIAKAMPKKRKREGL